MYYAHIREDGRTQTVQEHLQGSAALCARFAAQFGEAERGEQLGLAHDIGKTPMSFKSGFKAVPRSTTPQRER